MTTVEITLRLFGYEADTDCESLVGRALRQVRGVIRVDCDHSQHTVAVEFDPTMTAAPQLVHAVERFGYRVSWRTAALVA